MKHKFNKLLQDYCAKIVTQHVIQI